MILQVSEVIKDQSSNIICVSVLVKSIRFSSRILLCRVLSHIISIILRIKVFWMSELVNYMQLYYSYIKREVVRFAVFADVLKFIPGVRC